MTPKEYIENVLKTESIDFEKIKARMRLHEYIRLDHASDGLCTEAGEFKDELKKLKFYGKELDRINLVVELGDILWYIGIACDVLGITLEQVMEINIAKLNKRYGIYFNEEGAINRDLSAERDILEKNNPKTKIHFIFDGHAICDPNISGGSVDYSYSKVNCRHCIMATKIHYEKGGENANDQK